MTPQAPILSPMRELTQKVERTTPQAEECPPVEELTPSLLTDSPTGRRVETARVIKATQEQTAK